MWRRSPYNDVIRNLANAFEQALQLAVEAFERDRDSEAMREALSLAQTIIGEIAVEMRVQGSADLDPQRDGLAMMQAKLDATESVLMSRGIAT